MKNFFEISINLIEMFIVIAFLTNYLGPKYTGAKKVLGFLVGWFAAFCTVTIINHYILFESFATYIYVIVYFIYAIICLKGRFLLKLWMSIITQVIITMIAVFTILATSVILGCELITIMSDFTLIRVVAVIFTKVLLAIACFVITKSKNKNSNHKNSMWYKLILIPLISVISITKLMEVVIANPSADKKVLLSMFALVSANIMVYYFYTVLGEKYATELKVKLLEQQSENMSQYIESSEAFVKEMKMVRHDIKNHLIAIDNYLSNNKTKEAQIYIKSLYEGDLPNTKKYINTDNDAFNALINAKMSFCVKNNIQLDISVGANTILCLNSIDTGIIFGNLFDNALEAAVNTKEKYISIDVQLKAEYINILIKNSINNSVLSDNSELNTSKDNKELHGIGIQSVKSVIKKYDGMIDFFEENGMFCCQVSLYKNNLYNT